MSKSIVMRHFLLKGYSPSDLPVAVFICNAFIFFLHMSRSVGALKFGLPVSKNCHTIQTTSRQVTDNTQTPTTIFFAHFTHPFSTHTQTHTLSQTHFCLILWSTAATFFGLEFWSCSNFVDCLLLTFGLRVLQRGTVKKSTFWLLRFLGLGLGLKTEFSF